MKTLAALLVLLFILVPYCQAAEVIGDTITYSGGSSFAVDSKDYILLPAPMDQAEVDALLKEMGKGTGPTFIPSPVDKITFTAPQMFQETTLDDLLKAIEYGLEAMGHDPGVSPELTHGHSDLLYRPLPSEIDTLRARLKDLEERSRRINFMREAADKLRKAIEASK